MAAHFHQLKCINDPIHCYHHPVKRLGVLRHPGVRGGATDREGLGQQHADTAAVPRAAGVCQLPGRLGDRQPDGHQPVFGDAASACDPWPPELEQQLHHRDGERMRPL